MSDLPQRIAAIHERIETACKRAGRPVGSVKLMAVSKTHPPETIAKSYRAGLRLFGENRVQEFSTKKELLPLAEMKDARWHLIGHLQSNKAQRAIEFFDGIDVVDSLRLAERLNAVAEKENRKLPILLQINVGDEAQKTGFAPISRELEDLLRAAEQLGSLEIRGLMTVPPFRADPEEVRPFFRMLRELREDVARRKLPRISMDELSMGMSHDFEIAIEEGATCVRVGSAIFGERSSTKPKLAPSLKSKPEP